MDIGEKFFQWSYQKRKNSKLKIFKHQLLLKLETPELAARFEIIASALQEKPIQLFYSDALETPTPNTLYFPRELALASNQNETLLLCRYRILLFHGYFKYIHTLNLNSGKNQNLENISRNMDYLSYLQIIPKVHAFLSQEYPSFVKLLVDVQKIISPCLISFSEYDASFKNWGPLYSQLLQSELNVLSIKNLIIKNSWFESPYFPGHIFGSCPNLIEKTENLIEKVALPKAQKNELISNKKQNSISVKTKASVKTKNLKDQEINPLSHVFEKLLTIDQHNGGSKTQDGSDELEDHANALSEMTLENTLRTEAGADSFIKANVQLHSNIPELDHSEPQESEEIFYYPEWFVKEKKYRQKHCKVIEKKYNNGPHSTEMFAPLTPTSKTVSEKLSRFLNSEQWLKRQKDGKEIDLDETVRLRSDLKHDGPIEQRLYIGRRRIEREIAILILVDNSLSTDSWIGNNRILDVIKESVTILGNVFHTLDDQFAIANFNSYSRESCHFEWIKNFQTPWHQSKIILNQLKPEGYTRIGPALRHSTEKLRKIKARKKILFLLSDAKPTDYDFYEGKHGIADVKKASQEMKKFGIVFRGISLDPSNNAKLIQLFGSGKYQVIDKPEDISESVLKIFSELMRRN